MELRHLRYFVTVAECLHFGQAAARLQIAQPSLSHQIRQLETELDTTLLQRTKRHVELTEAGRLFLAEAREVLARADRAAMIARRANDRMPRLLRIGVLYCADQAQVSEAIGRFHEQHGDVRVELQTLGSRQQQAALGEDRLDIGFVRPPVTDSSLSSEIVAREPLLVALPTRHPLAGKEPVALSALAAERLIVPPRETVPVLHDIVLRACREAGFVPHAPHEADHLHMILGLVQGGSGLALVPAYARKLKPRSVSLLELRTPPYVETALAWRRKNTAAAAHDFIRIALRVVKRARNHAG